MTVHIAVITLFPEMFDAITAWGVTSRAVKQKLVNVRCFNPRDYTTDKHRTVDDRPYGGGPGMVMKIEPLEKALSDARSWLEQENNLPVHVVYLSPQGSRFTQQAAEYYRRKGSLVLIAGRYEGIDERFIAEHVDEECSIGDYVLSGGELPAMVVMDAITRLQPGALGDAGSAEQDSFMNGLLDCPHYTRPEVYRGRTVPEVLLSGDHAKIDRWRQMQSLGRTEQRRPDLLKQSELSTEQQKLLAEFRHLHSAQDD